MSDAIEPFHLDIPQTQMDGLRRRLEHVRIRLVCNRRAGHGLRVLTG